MSSPQRLTAMILLVISIMVSTGPFATDMYLPTLPQLGEDLHASASLVQATISAFMIGMAVGQVVVGPLSDSHGRRPYLIGGTLVAVGGGVLAAAAPTIEVLIAGRIIMGLGSGAAMVVARAIIPDLAKGPELARSFSLLMLLQSVAPIIAPILGGLLAEPVGWRGLLWVLAGLAALQAVLGILILGETHPPQRRTAGGLQAFVGNLGGVLGSRPFVGYMLAMGLFAAAFFSYIAGSPFVLQQNLGFSVGQYTAAFASFTALMSVGALVNTRLVERFSPARISTAVLAVAVLGSATVLLAGLGAAPAPAAVVMCGLLLAVSGNSIVLANTSALATEAAGRYAGTGQALLGAVPFGLGGLISPLVGVSDNQVLSLGVIMTVSTVAALGFFRWAVRQHAAHSTS